MIGAWWNQVSATATHGLQITVVGMLLVFFTLGLIIISMVLLTQLPWLKAREEAEEEEEEIPTPAATPAQTSAVPQAADDELAQIAAIAVALARTQQRNVPITRGLSRPLIRATGSHSAGGWKMYGRAHQLGL